MEKHPRTKGKSRYVVTFTANKVRQRRYFKTEKAAKAERKRLRDDINKAGAAWVALKAKERADIISVLHEVQESKLCLRRVWLEHQEFTKTLGRRTKPLDEALEFHLRDMEENERGSRYVDGLDQYLGMFIRGREKLGVDRIGKEDVEQWFRGRGEKGMVKLSNMGRLSSFFNYCFRSGWIVRNPVQLLTKPTVRGKVPVIVSVPEFKRVLFVCFWKFGDYFPYLVLTLICGIRPEEAEELVWEDIDLEHRTIEVNKTSAADKRVIPLDDAMVFWLGLCRFGAPKEKIALNKTTLRRRRRALYKLARIKSVQDIMRHSAGSYMFSYWQSFDAEAGVVHEKALRVLGHGSRMFFKHYRQMIRSSIGRATWEWRPRLNIPVRLIPPHTRAAKLFGVREIDLGRSHENDLASILAIAKALGNEKLQIWAVQPHAALKGETPLDWMRMGRSRKVLAALRELQAARAI